MDNLKKEIKVLQFYVAANELKNKIIDYDNNYSIADHLFGSMILATAIDSEFNEIETVSKIYKMLLLDEFGNLYPNHELDDDYIKIQNEARNMFSIDGKLVFKYKMLDFLLTKLIKEKENFIPREQLINDGSQIISSLCNKKPNECEEIFEFYYLNFRLKDKKRTGWDEKHWNIQSNRIETVSEHVIGSIALAMGLNMKFKYNIDIDKVLKMLVIHEIGETLIGDITPFDGITPEMKREIEHKAMKDALGNLKEKDAMLALLFEFDDVKTLEAKYSHSCDKEDADLKSKIYQDKKMHHPLNEQQNNVVFKSPKIQQMVKNGAKDAFDIWYEWDKSIYAEDKDFPEFIKILDIAKENDLFSLDNIINNDNKYCLSKKLKK